MFPSVRWYIYVQFMYSIPSMDIYVKRIDLVYAWDLIRKTDEDRFDIFGWARRFYNQWTQKTEKDQGLKSQTYSSEEKED